MHFKFQALFSLYFVQVLCRLYIFCMYVGIWCTFFVLSVSNEILICTIFVNNIYPKLVFCMIFVYILYSFCMFFLSHLFDIVLVKFVLFYSSLFFFCRWCWHAWTVEDELWHYSFLIFLLRPIPSAIMFRMHEEEVNFVYFTVRIMRKHTKAFPPVEPVVIIYTEELPLLMIIQVFL